MKRYSLINNLSGWIVFLIASITYLSTIEPTASFWDCGEFISASYKLEVGHPPGAPLFLLIGRFFTFFAGGNKEMVAIMVNIMSALASAFTVLFLFWTITHLVKKIISSKESLSLAENISVIASGVVGSLAYTFSDTFWFSAVEGEVYASSSLFTAMVFWAILKWENIADEKYANRWLILIAYLMGLSIGVHLLNLLAIPAIVLIFYFRKFKTTKKGIFITLLISGLILGGLMYILIPGIVGFAGIFERIFVNGFGLPYWSGIFFYFLVIVLLLIYGIIYTHNNGHVIANTALLIISVIIIGYSSYVTIVIRSLANPPMDQNNPENIFNLLSYLNRDQYGDRPLIYGQYFNAPIKSSLDGKTIYARKNNKYVGISHQVKYKYDEDFKTIFPRMYSQQEEHIDAYLKWTGLDESDFYEVQKDQNGNTIRNRFGEMVYDHRRPLNKPGFANNIEFFFKYQLGHMYFRYFMWNFSGRQNDIQSQFKEEINKGNWITGIKFLDSKRLGNQNFLPDSIAKNMAFNKLYMLPLAIGLIGLFFQYKRDRKNFWVVMTLFFFTGIAIVIYLNQNPIQPRERDYAYAGSFYAFAIWIGISVFALFKAAQETNFKELSKFGIRGLIAIVIIAFIDILINGMLGFTWSAFFLLVIITGLLFLIKVAGSLSKNKIITVFLSVALTLPIPLIMARQNLNDHNRSGRYMARDFAANYLNSCEKNAILYTNGDNDTFPLWYAQEVEGIRTDVRVVNLSYLSADWYIKQMGRKVYESEPVKMSLTEDKYETGKREIVYVADQVKGPINLKEGIAFIAEDNPDYKKTTGYGELIDYLPQHKLRLEADSLLVFGNGTINSANEKKYTRELIWSLKQNYIYKNHLMTLDFLASNNWERPIYYAMTVPDEYYNNMQDYFEMQGLAYRIVPAKLNNPNNYIGGINSSLMYSNITTKFRWGGIENPDVYLDENMVNMFSNMRHVFQNLSSVFIAENKLDSAEFILDYCQELIPDSRIPYDIYMLEMVNNYYELNKPVKAEKLARSILNNTCRGLDYTGSLQKPFVDYLQYEKSLYAHVIREIVKTVNEKGTKEFNMEIRQKIEKYAYIFQSEK